MAFVKFTTGVSKGKRFEIDRDEIIIGRAPDNVITIEDPAVSGRHCAIIRQGRRFTLRDLGSTNGTRLNSVKVKEYRLSPKDVITVGSEELTFDGDDVEVDEKQDIPPTIARRPVRNGGSASASSGTVRSPFETRRDSKWLWISLIVIVGILTLGALGWFLIKLFE